MQIYGYCRISTPRQNIERQVRNITAAYPDAVIIKEIFTGTKFQGRKQLEQIIKTIQKGDTIVFDSVSRMSRNADEGFELYESLYEQGVTLCFLKEPHIYTDTYKKALETGIPKTGTNVDYILEGINKYLMALAKEQIRLAFEQSEKEVADLHQRTKEGLVTARLKGKQIGQKPGIKLVTKKSIDAKRIIQQYNKPCIVVLSKEKTKILLAAAEKTPWYLEILLALFLGLRKGEIYGLKYSDIDMENETVRISRQVVYEPVIIDDEGKVEEYQSVEKEPKTHNSKRFLRVPKPIIAEILKRQRKAELRKEQLSEAYIDNGYISCQENGKPHSTSALNKALTTICRQNALPHITVHGLRHMFATILLEQGVALSVVSCMLGHSSIHTTFEYYIEQMDERDRIISFMNDSFVPEGGEG